jgi:hypothetical protein
VPGTYGREEVACIVPCDALDGIPMPSQAEHGCGFLLDVPDFDLRETVRSTGERPRALRTHNMIAPRTRQHALRRPIPHDLSDLSPAMRRRAVPLAETSKRNRPILGRRPPFLLPPGKLVLGIMEIPQTDLGIFPRRHEETLRRVMRCPRGIEDGSRVSTDEGDQVGQFGAERGRARGRWGVEGGGSGEDGECSAARDLPVDGDEFLRRESAGVPRTRCRLTPLDFIRSVSQALPEGYA